MIKNPLKVLIVASWFKDERHPTAGSFIDEQAKMLARRGHEVTVVHPYLKGKFFNTIRVRTDEIKTYEERGVKVVKLGIVPVFPKARHLSYQKLCKKTLKVLTTHGLTDYDIIHSHAMFMGGGRWEISRS